MSKRITPTITRVSQFGSLVNAYLVQEDDGLTLIDGLQGNQSKRILAAAEALGQPIARVTVTHAHPDHVGAIDPILAQLPEAEFIVGRRESKLLAAKPQLEPGEPTNGKLMPRDGGVKAVPTRTIEHGEMIGSLKAIWSPGHSIGHLSFLDTRDGALICGDVYSTVGGVATTAGPFWRFPLPGLFTWHRPTVLESAGRLADLEPSVLLPGHGGAAHEPVNAMRAAIARRASIAQQAAA
jgi:glyoxylase-like metal-dependent hydrolase (beta-lactamase superfamily II)